MLKELQAEHGGEFQKLRFVEDKLSTLEKVVDEAALEDWELYFVDWGFNTAGETRRRRRTGSRRTAGTDARAALQRSGPRPPRTRASSSSTSRGSRPCCASSWLAEGKEGEGSGRRGGSTV